MTAKYIFFFILRHLIFVCKIAGSDAIDYCGPEICNNSKQHTLCRFQNSGPAKGCIGYERILKTDEDKIDLLNKLNSRRNKIAAGDVRSLPASENMMSLIWNRELEKSSQRWADQCVKQNEHSEDLCRDLGTASVGQNVASVYGDSPGLSPLSLVDIWFMELLNINSSVLPRYYPSTEKGYLHYEYFTQLVWAKSTEVGCSAVKFVEQAKYSTRVINKTVHRLVCNFLPGGNVLGEAVYDVGPPCSRCPYEAKCHLSNKALCDTTSNRELASHNEQYQVKSSEYNYFEKLLNVSKDNISDNTEFREDNSSALDYFSEIFDYKNVPTTTVISPISCKDAIAIDELVELLKRKITNDPLFKYLLSFKNLTNDENLEPSFSDRNVAAFVKRIYSKKALTTTTKLPDQDFVNSTLLADLVEAVIFRSGDKAFTTDQIKETSSALPDVSPIKIQAEFGEVKINNDFTGHYFFPEDNFEVSETETTEVYDDSPSPSVSDVLLEIENLSRERITHDFLDEIIDSDTRNGERNINLSMLKNDMVGNTYNTAHLYGNTRQLRHVKLSITSQKDDSNIIVEYADLLRRLASDLKLLKLNYWFYCSESSKQNILKNNNVLVLLILALNMFSFMI